MSEVAANGWTFTVRTTGPSGGRPVVLLHGFPQDSRAFTPLMTVLGDAGYRSAAPDQRGYSDGARPLGVAPYAVDHLLADVDGVATALGMDAFDLVGHDWGGFVAWRYAAAVPERVRTLTVVSTPHPAALAATLAAGDEDQAARSSYIELFRQPGAAEALMLGEDEQGSLFREMMRSTGLTPELADAYVDRLCRPGALTAALNWYRATDLLEPVDLAPITAPTLYVWSTEDVALGRTAAEATARYVAGPYRFEVLDGVDHWIPESAPDLLGALVLDHLAAG